MMSSKDFRSLVLDQAADQFERQPDSLLFAYTVLWAIDAYASHVAFEKLSPACAADPKHRENAEKLYKKQLVSCGRQGAWQYRVVREASNAGKHALRSNTRLGVEHSRAVASKPIEGWLWFFMGGPTIPWGAQVIVELDLDYDHEQRVLLDRDRKPFIGPSIKWIPVYSLIAPSMELISSTP